jgi:hypothetical protein
MVLMETPAGEVQVVRTVHRAHIHQIPYQAAVSMVAVEAAPPRMLLLEMELAEQ